MRRKTEEQARLYTAEEIFQASYEDAADWPPLTPEQIDDLVVILSPSVTADPGTQRAA